MIIWFILLEFGVYANRTTDDNMVFTLEFVVYANRTKEETEAAHDLLQLSRKSHTKCQSVR